MKCAGSIVRALAAAAPVPARIIPSRLQPLSRALQKPPSMELAQSLLDRRDEYISIRINETLLDGELGLLFLGLNHRIEGRLASDITLIQPLGELRQGK